MQEVCFFLPSHKSKYRKFPKYSDTQNICCNYSKIWTMWLYHRVMCPNNADGMANSVDPDQTCSLIWVCTVCPGISVQKLRIFTVSFEILAVFCKIFIVEKERTRWFLMFPDMHSCKAQASFIAYRTDPKEKKWAVILISSSRLNWLPVIFRNVVAIIKDINYSFLILLLQHKIENLSDFSVL